MMASSRPRRHAVGDDYDVAVIGSGVGGMAAAAILANAGLSVFVAEQGEGLGGYAHAYHRGPYVIDPAVHLVGDPRFFDVLLRHLGVRDECSFIEPDIFYSTVVGNDVLHAPLTSPEAFVDAHAEAFPRHADDVRSFFGLCAQVHREGHELPGQLGLGGLDDVAKASPALFRYRRARLSDVLTEQLRDPRARAFCAASSLILGHSASVLPFQTFAQVLMSYLVDGAFYVKGGVQRIIDALARSIENNGGAVVTRTPVVRIRIDGDRADGIVLGDGSVVTARAVVSNASVPHTFGDLVPPDRLPSAFVSKLRRLTPSVSGFLVFLATTLDIAKLDRSHQFLSIASVDLELEYERTLRGEPGLVLSYVPTLVDPSLAPSGEHVLTASIARAYDIGRSWDVERKVNERALLDELGRLYPGLTEELVFVDSATPLTLERFTRNTSGAIYGWANTLEHMGGRRPAQRTPLRGLYLAGHWTHPGPGFLRAAVSGIHAAELVLRDSVFDGAMSTFAYARLPPAA